MRRWGMWFAVLVLACTLAGCGRGGKQSVYEKAKDIKTKADMESALGKPDEMNAGGIGPLSGEVWKYKCSDGIVVVTIAGDKVVTVVTADK